MHDAFFCQKKLSDMLIRQEHSLSDMTDNLCQGLETATQVNVKLIKHATCHFLPLVIPQAWKSIKIAIDIREQQ